MTASVNLFEVLTPHFKLYEFLLSGTRSAYHNALNLDVFFRHPKQVVIITNIMRLAKFLETIRLKYRRPISITSGFRCPTVNTYYGGSDTSHHLTGRAVDIRYSPELAKICELYRDQTTELIINKSKNYIHIAL